MYPIPFKTDITYFTTLARSFYVQFLPVVCLKAKMYKEKPRTVLCKN